MWTWIRKISRTLLLSTALVLPVGCLFPEGPIDTQPGSVSISLTLQRASLLALAKVASADTIFRVDTLYISLSSTGQTTINQKYVITGRADSGSLSILPTKVFTGLAPLRTWKAKFTVVDTTLNPSRIDTTHIDSVSFFVKPSDTTFVSYTAKSRYSILKARIFSTSGTLLLNSIRKLRLKVDGVVAESLSLNATVFDNTLTYKYLTPGTDHVILLQAFDINNANTRGYEKTDTINVISGRDTSIIDSVSVISGNAQSGSTSTTIKLSALASSVTNFYNGMTVGLTSGAGSGQSRLITAYNATTKIATISPAWTTTPTTNGFIVYHRNLLTTCGRSGFPSCSL